MRPSAFFVAAAAILFAPSLAPAQQWRSPSQPSVGYNNSIPIVNPAVNSAQVAPTLQPLLPQVAPLRQQPVTLVPHLSGTATAPLIYDSAVTPAVFGSANNGTYGYCAPTYGTPAIAPPQTFQAQTILPPQPPAPWVGAGAPRFDSYNASPAFGAAPTPFYPTPIIAGRRGYVEVEGRAGSNPEELQGNLFVPFAQTQDAFWFGDFRGHFDDERAVEGSWGLAYRKHMGGGYFGTVYGFYDLRHTRNNNNFQGVTVGAEVMTLEWEVRVNGYLPEGGGQAVAGAGIATRVNDTIVVQSGVERAYYGIDAEYGLLLMPLGGAYDGEVRGFVGGYYFDTNAPGFNAFGGPRARLEARFYDLPFLGQGSRLVFGGTFQYDEFRQEQGIGSVNLRIPFGGGSTVASRMSPLERRMLSPIRRDADIITSVGLGAQEAAIIEETGQLATNVTFIDGSTAANMVDNIVAAAGNDSIVVFEDTQGVVDASDTIVLNPGQFVGGQFDVRGADSGQVISFGAKTTVNGTNAAVDIFQLANNSTISGLNITGVGAAGAQNGIFGNGVSGFSISNNMISGAGTNAIDLQGAINGSVKDNMLTNSFAGDGLNVDNFVTGTIRGNTAENNAINYDFVTITGGTISDNKSISSNGDGFQVATFDGGTFSGNSSTMSGDDGYQFSTVNGGSIVQNSATENDDSGFFINSLNNTAKVTNNFATDNKADGYFISTINNGTFSNNTATGNDFDGFDINTFSNGTLSNNTAKTNGDVGFEFTTVSGGTISSNSAQDNTGNGFAFTNVNTSATVSTNSSSSNKINGFLISTLNGGDVNGNTATLNTLDGFQIGNFADGNFDNNVSNNNTGKGYNVLPDPLVAPAAASGNTATGNTVDDIVPQFP